MRVNVNYLLNEEAYYIINGDTEAMEKIEQRIELHDTKQDNAHIRDMKRKENRDE